MKPDNLAATLPRRTPPAANLFVPLACAQATPLSGLLPSAFCLPPTVHCPLPSAPCRLRSRIHHRLIRH